MDFTPETYKRLLEALKEKDYEFKTFGEFMDSPGQRSVVLRHDVDKLPENALQTAAIEKEAGIKGTYYFRTVKGAWQPEIARKISQMGHETGYHYETIETAFRKISGRFPLCLKITSKGRYSKEELIDAAYGEFRKNLKKMREHVPVTTAAMHGSPLSPFNNLLLWEKYDYRELGITGEPYMDVDYSKVLYLTDTGRRWNNTGLSIRDKVNHGYYKELIKTLRTTQHLIRAIKENRLPGLVIINIHPQRWTSNVLPWVRELIWQNTKNLVKKMIVLRSR